MFSRVDPAGYAEIKARHHARIAPFPLVNAVISGRQSGFVYADAARGSVFIATRSGFSSMSAHDDAAAFDTAGFFAFLHQCVDVPRYIHLYDPPRTFQEHLERHFDTYKCRRRAQFRYYATQQTREYERLLPPDHRIATVQEVGCEKLDAVFKLQLAGRYWNSADDFTSTAIGACIVTTAGEPLAICYSACIVDGIAEMDTMVLPDHRGKKFMRIVSEPFFNLAIARGLVPHWDTFVSNVPSYQLAQSFHLASIQEYDLVSVFLASR